jgi:argininosuccinate lyase
MPSGYHRDLQLIKKPLFRAFDSVGASARLLAHALPAVDFDATRMREAVDPSLGATERAYRLVVEEGLTFREAYRRARGE